MLQHLAVYRPLQHACIGRGGQSDLVECISNPEACSMSDDCQVRLAWKEATRVLYEKLDAISIADRMGNEYTGKA